MNRKTVYLSANSSELGEIYYALSAKLLKIFPAWELVYFTPEMYRAVPFAEVILGLQSCDLFIGVIGYCYGDNLDDHTQSISEMEINWVLKERKDLLLFLASEDFLSPAKIREPDEKWNKQKSFRNYVQYETIISKVMCHTFTTEDELFERILMFIRNWNENLAPFVPNVEPEIPQNPNYTIFQNSQILFSPIVKEFNIMSKKENKNDTYHNEIHGPVGGIGRKVRARDQIYTETKNEIENEIDVIKLANDLFLLREELSQKATEAHHHVAIGVIAASEIEAKQGNKSNALQNLSTVGKWALDIAKEIGVEVAVAAIKASSGL